MMLLIIEQRRGEIVALSLKNKKVKPTQGWMDVGTKSSSINKYFILLTSKIWHCYFGFVDVGFVVLHYMEPIILWQFLWTGSVCPWLVQMDKYRGNLM